ncbi:MAG: ribonuclease III [Caldilineaceae bacterium]|nr:ribonuclease III [Caldilineaceae bacterium]
MFPKDIVEFEQLLPAPFADRALLQHAFIHRSYLNEVEDTNGLEDNERLEFLGDSVLGFVVSQLLFDRFPGYHEGDLTNLRSALVRQRMLSSLASRLHMGEYLHLGKGEEDSGGRTRPATLCATFEAVVGAIYMDRGIDAVHEFLLPIIERELEVVHGAAMAKDAKSRLQEWSQSILSARPHYKLLLADGPDHDKVFTMQTTIGGVAYGIGRGRSKQSATQSAAAMALYRLGLHAPEYQPNPELEAEWPLPDVDLDLE